MRATAEAIISPTPCTHNITHKSKGNNASPTQPGRTLRLHTLSPDTQGGWHQHRHPKPAAADNEGHE